MARGSKLPPVRGGDPHVRRAHGLGVVRDRGTRSESPEAPLSARGQFDYGLDALGAMLRAARMGVDFYGQYFWLRYDDGEPEFAVEFANGTFAARYTLHLFALFTRTQERGAVRLRDTTSLPPRVSFLTLESPRTGAAKFRSHYFVNERASVPVDFAPSRPNSLWRYSVDFAVHRGLTMQEAAQPLTNGRARFTLAPNSAAVLTERQLAAPLNWTPTV